MNNILLLDKIIPTVCIADGGGFGVVENQFTAFLKHYNIAFVEHAALYEQGHDLSIYPTIAFSTTGRNANRLKSLMSFDTSNLKTIVALNHVAAELIIDRAQMIANLLRFDLAAWDMQTEYILRSLK